MQDADLDAHLVEGLQMLGVAADENHVRRLMVGEELAIVAAALEQDRPT
jgi:hypothetical protein